MKKYLRFMAFAMTAVFSLAVISCGEDETEPNEPNNPNTPGGNSTSTKIGVLEGDDAAANAAVADLRLTEVKINHWSYNYTYNDQGSLETITDHGDDWVASVKDNFKIEYNDDYDDYKSVRTFEISNNVIISSTEKVSAIGKNGEIRTWIEVTNFKYNAKGQLVSIKLTYDETDSDGWYDKENYTTTITYAADGRTTQVDCTAREEYSTGQYTYESTMKYEYDSPGIVNTFYQYTPNIFEDIAYGFSFDHDAFAYVGLWGKATSYMPARGTFTYMENYDDEEDLTDGSSTVTYSYTFNSDGTLQSMSGWQDCEYIYTNVDTRSVFETNEPTWGQTHAAKRRRIPLHTRMKSMRERHHQLNGK